MESNVKTPSGTFLSIDMLYAFVAADEKGEGIMGIQGPNKEWLPMVGADMERVKQLYPVAKQISNISGKSFKVIKFSKREDITDQVNA